MYETSYMSLHTTHNRINILNRNHTWSAKRNKFNIIIGCELKIEMLVAYIDI
jgi:hypothetical protein